MALGTGAGLAIAGASSLLGGLLGSKASKDAASAQTQAAQSANDLQWKMFQEQMNAQAPYREAGTFALGQLRDLLGPGGGLTGSFQPGDISNDPGYQFRLAQGQKALERSAAARGGLLSGGTAKALDRYSQGLASDEYMNAYNRWRANQGDVFNRFASLAGVGQTSVGQLGQAGQNYANMMGQNIMGAGNARAAGIVGGANAWGSALGQGSNLLGQWGMMQGGFTPFGRSSNANTLADLLPVGSYGMSS
jgi:hypothetical protein